MQDEHRADRHAVNSPRGSAQNSPQGNQWALCGGPHCVPETVGWGAGASGVFSGDTDARSAARSVAVYRSIRAPRVCLADRGVLITHMTLHNYQ